MSNFRNALLWTAIPLVTVSIASAAFGVLTRIYPNSTLLAIASILPFQAAFLLVIVALVMVVVAGVGGKKQRAAGILAGLGIGLLAYFASCLAYMD